MPLFSSSGSGSRKTAASASSSSSSSSSWWRKGGSNSGNNRGRGKLVSGTKNSSGIFGGDDISTLPLPFAVPIEVLWMLRQCDWNAVLDRSHSAWKIFSSLPRETQSLLSWVFLLFIIIFIPGLWTIKLALLAFLMLFKPFEDPQKRRERIASAGVGKGKGKMRKGGSRAKGLKPDEGFSADPLISALQRIPETFTLGNIPTASSVPSTVGAPNRMASSPPPFEGRLPSGSHPLPIQSPQQQYHPSLQLLREGDPPAYDTSSSTDSGICSRLAEGSGSSSSSRRTGIEDRDYINRRKPGVDHGIGLGPAPLRPAEMILRGAGAQSAQGNRAVTAPLQHRQPLPTSMSMTSAIPGMMEGMSLTPSLSTLSQIQRTVPLHFSPSSYPPQSQSYTATTMGDDQRPTCSAQTSIPPLMTTTTNEDPFRAETVWEEQQRQVLMNSGTPRHKSASFHRLEQAQKFWNRKFSSGTLAGES